MMKYRPEIDGLRALAVVPVILYHAGIVLFGGGYVGVDVFFVISGYLITGIILREHAEGGFRLGRFYERRVRRILPALFLVILCSIPFAWAWMTPPEYERFSQSIMATILFLSNVYFWRDGGYFQTDKGLDPLLHTWSLSVEEQYYLLFPLFLILMLKFGRRTALGAIAALGLGSLALSQWGSVHHPVENFFFTFSRMWELMAGALCVFALPHPRPRLGGALALAGLILIAFSMVYYTAATPFPSVYTLMPVAGTVLIILFAHPVTLVGRLLSLKPVIAVGLISYSAYLWHQPLFAFARVRSIYPPGPVTMLGLSVLALGLAYLTWRFVEQPVRQRKPWAFPTRKGIFAASLVVATGLFSVGLWGDVRNGLPGRLSPDVVRFFKSADWDKSCLFQKTDRLPHYPVQRCILNKGGKFRIAVWGDSVAASLSAQIAATLRDKSVEVHQITHGHCMPVLGARTGGKAPHSEACPAFNSNAVAYINQGNFDAVILSGLWVALLEHPQGSVFDGAGRLTPAQANAAASKALSDTISALKPPALVVFPHAISKHKVVEVAGKSLFQKGHVPNLGVPLADFHTSSQNTRLLLQKLVQDNHVAAVYPEKIFCNSFVKGQCAFTFAGQLLLADRVHFSPHGAALVATDIARQLDSILRHAPATEDAPTR